MNQNRTSSEPENKPLPVTDSAVEPLTYAAKGSQRWLQVAVGETRDLLNSRIAEALKLAPDVAIEWLSPVKERRYWEYQDAPFVKLLDLDLKKRSLESFWPKSGARWDGLARTSDGQYLLVEAKGHLSELLSSPSLATGNSLVQIKASLEETRSAIAPKTSSSWTSIFYQYTNRLAHLYLLRELNGKKAHLVYVYFTNAYDVGGPASQEEWNGAIKLMLAFLGLSRHKLSKYIHKIFVDVNELPPATRKQAEAVIPTA
jgi:hypothetical protein